MWRSPATVCLASYTKLLGACSPEVRRPAGSLWSEVNASAWSAMHEGPAAAKRAFGRSVRPTWPVAWLLSSVPAHASKLPQPAYTCASTHRFCQANPPAWLPMPALAAGEEPHSRLASIICQDEVCPGARPGAHVRLHASRRSAAEASGSPSGSCRPLCVAELGAAAVSALAAAAGGGGTHLPTASVQANDTPLPPTPPPYRWTCCSAQAGVCGWTWPPTWCRAKPRFSGLWRWAALSHRNGPPACASCATQCATW